MTAATVHEPERDPAEVLLEGFHALETPEGFRAELIEGEILVTPPPRGDHEDIIASVNRQVTKHSVLDVDFSGNKGLLLDRGGLCVKNHLIPDGVFAPVRAFKGEDAWMPVDKVLMVVEVTSSNPDRDRTGKRYCYARGGVPLYLLVDRHIESVTLFGEPGGAGDLIDYRQEIRVPFGKPLELPAPFALTLDTGEFE
ncbi:Uma2 family endonuclease [Nocardia arizonensis]|uniref:Uma2 family endonuclease n=1 Tax=Nocardia arizonensis TaxID=1141647 RepID=UPI0006D0D984|nr:Uma2 family endonuclease [Nocardia arizonensis]